jgi:hypothetical protein
MRHVCTNFTIEIADANHATGICYLMVFRHDPGPETANGPLPSQPVSLGEFHDTFVNQAGTWRFQSRTLRRIFRGMS